MDESTTVPPVPTGEPQLVQGNDDAESEEGSDRRSLGLQLFASARDEPRSRRPVDGGAAIVTALVVVIAGLASRSLTELEQGVSQVVADVPGGFDILWRLMFWSPVAWSLVLLGVAVGRTRATLARDLVIASCLGLVGAAASAAIVMDDGIGFADLLFDVDGPPVFPPALVVVATAAMSVASPHLTRPFRKLASWLIPMQVVGAVLLGAATPSGGVAAIALGLLAAAIVHLSWGSPGGRPTLSRVQLALTDLGLLVGDLTAGPTQREGVALFEGHDEQGALRVKVYGRDAGDARLLADTWRRLWYRGAERSTRQSGVQLVEHEGLITLLAQRAGAHVPGVVTAGTAERGDALVVVRPIGDPLASRAARAATPSETGPPTGIDRDAVTRLWHEIHQLHDAGIVHRSVDLDRVVVTPEGSLALGDLSSATLAGQPEDVAADRAQVLALSILLLGEEEAVAVVRTFGDDAVVAVLPFLQEAAMPPLARTELRRRKLDLNDVRTRLSSTLDAEEQPLVKLRRVSWKSLVNALMLGVAGFALVNALSDLDLASFVDALGDADWWLLALALVLAQVPRVPAAVSTMGSIERPLPLGPLTALQFAISYVNLAIPSTAARIAVNIRFFQRFGVDKATATTAGAIDSASGFLVQVFLFVLLFFWSDIDLDLELGTDDLSGLGTTALIAVAAIVGIACLVLALPSWRRRAVETWTKVRGATAVLRSPTKWLQLYGGNLLSQVLFAVALGVCVRAFDETLPLTSLILINTVVTLFAGLLPVPGGMGVSEAGLTAGLTAAGMPADVAFAAALSYRFASFYLPPIWGYVCYDGLVKRRYL